MSKRGNGQSKIVGDGITVLKQRVAGLAARVDEFRGGLATAVAERDSIEAALPELRAAAFVRGDEAAKAEMQSANLRLGIVHDQIGGFEHELSREKADLAEATAQLKTAERAEQIAEIDALRRRCAEDIAEALAALHTAGTALGRAGEMHDAANRLASEIDEPIVEWRSVARRVEAVAVLELDKQRGRYPINLDMPRDVARRVVASQ